MDVYNQLIDNNFKGLSIAKQTTKHVELPAF